jgi:anthranilate phosphoribosyltransferase
MTTTGRADIQRALSAFADGHSLSRAATRELFAAIMSGAATNAQIGGALMALRVTGETVAELAGAAEALRDCSTKVEIDVPYLVDTCGTGGSGAAKLFNISTAAAFVAAAAGAHVAKHGNRAASSRSGSADVLEAAGVNIALSPAQIARCIREVGVGFMLAVAHHSAMRHAIGPRRELGVRTIFNLVAPLTNPAGALAQVIGVSDPRWQRPLAEVLRELGSTHVLLVHADGLDEISIASPTHVVELARGTLSEYDIAPEDFGMARGSLAGLGAGSVHESLALVRQSLGEPDCAAAQIVALNAGAAIYASGVATTLRHGVTMAEDAIASGLAAERLDELVRVSSLMAHA